MTLLTFSVYMPYKFGANCFHFYMSKDDTVGTLRRAIRESLDLKDEVESQDIFLLKCELPMGEPAKRYGIVMESLRDFDKSKAMEPASLLKYYFPNGPSPVSDRKIDVVVVTESIVIAAQGRQPSTSVGEPPNVKLMSRLDKDDTQRLVDEILDTYSDKLREYLSGPPWKSHWKTSPIVDEQTRAFIDGLEIPQVQDSPVLLLHNLGNGVVNSGFVDNLFTEESKFLVNTSGSGKSRLLLEGLTRHWGFYHVISSETNQSLGSRDMESVIYQISRSTGFIREPGQLPADDQTGAYHSNDSIAIRRVCQNLTARVLVFEYFLKMVKETCPSKPVNGFKQHWLFLQLLSGSILGRDIFVELFRILRDASDDFLKGEVLEVDLFLKTLQGKFGLDEKFYLVLDEAQAALKTLPESFRSDGTDTRSPLLRPIIRMWSRATDFPIIIAGTSLSIDVVDDAVNSAIMKPLKFGLVTRTGYFDTKEQQRRYMLHYMPSHLAETASGKELLHRAWTFARGRHRFTANLLTQLLKFSFQSPHRIFGEFVKSFCGFAPTDAQRFVEEEPDVENIEQVGAGMGKLDFSQIYRDGFRLAEVSSAVYTWLLCGEAKQLITLARDLVEIGLARFFNTEIAYIDEPLVLLAAAKEFGNRGFSLNAHVKAPLTDPSNKNDFFEKFVAYYITCAFGNKTRLCDIFHFGESPPTFALQTAELVSVAFTDCGVEANRFNWLIYEGSAANIGFNAKHSRQLTMEWLKDPSTLLCFPDNAMGPDIIFFIRVAGVILAVLVQCRWQAKRTLDAETLDSARNALDIQEIYERGHLSIEDGKEGKECVFDLLHRLKGDDFDPKASAHMGWDGWFPEGLPVLRVVASFPSETPESREEPHYATLNMEKCRKLADGEGLLIRLAESLGIKLRSSTEVQDGLRPHKKPRMS